MSFLLKILGGSLGPYLAGAAAVALGLALLVAGVQTARLKHAKSDLNAARASLIDPASRRTWKAVAESAIGSRDACLVSLGKQNAALAVHQAESARQLGIAAREVAEANRGRASAEARAARLLAHPPAGIDACARSEAAYQAVMESLR